jgi:dolichol-phosphate mannosyltransferase/undecaprenyl-phosphate 4-deoxy-4-formamido-L-arabinose transferase
VIPVYNSEKTLEELVRRIGNVFENLNRSYEIVLTEDGSKDSSWKVIEYLNEKGFPIKAFRFMKNHGQHYALKCGLDHCCGKYAITMDDDMQNPPEEIPKLIKEIESNPEIDVVIGKYATKKHSLFRNAGTKLHKHIRNAIFKEEKGLSLTSFRIINRPVLDEIKKNHHARPRIGLILLTTTNRITNIPVKHKQREVGKSGYTLAKMIGNTIDNIVNYSSLPLRIVSYLGIISSFFSMLLALFYFLSYLMGRITVSGFITISLLILFTSGAILFSFGLIGEYLIRIISQQLMHNQYTIRTKISYEKKRNQGEQ